jgi:hypothetical protein
VGGEERRGRKRGESREMDCTAWVEGMPNVNPSMRQAHEGEKEDKRVIKIK